VEINGPVTDEENWSRRGRRKGEDITTEGIEEHKE